MEGGKFFSRGLCYSLVIVMLAMLSLFIWAEKTYRREVSQHVSVPVDYGKIEVDTDKTTKELQAQGLEGKTQESQSTDVLVEKPITKARVALIIVDVGLEEQLTKIVTADLPKNISLGFSLYSTGLDELVVGAHKKGHECSLCVPLYTVGGEDHMATLANVLARKLPLKGLIPLGLPGVMPKDTILTDLQKMAMDNYLMLVDLGESLRKLWDFSEMQGKLPYLKVAIQIDEEVSRLFVREALQKLEDKARVSGQAIGWCHPYPVVIEEIKEWLKTHWPGENKEDAANKEIKVKAAESDLKSISVELVPLSMLTKNASL